MQTCREEKPKRFEDYEDYEAIYIQGTKIKNRKVALLDMYIAKRKLK